MTKRVGLLSSQTPKVFSTMLLTTFKINSVDEQTARKSLAAIRVQSCTFLKIRNLQWQKRLIILIIKRL